MHVLISAFGSYGDVLPMVGIGTALRARGHRVQMMVNPYFQSIVEGADVEPLLLGSADEYLDMTRHPDMWHPRRGLKLVLAVATSYLRQAYGLIEANFNFGETVLAAHGLELASRVFHDKHNAPLATVHFAPFALMSLHETARYIGVPDMRGWPRWAKRAIFWLGDRLIVDPVVTPELNRLRGEKGLSAVRHVYLNWNHSPLAVLGMFPEWFGPPQPDWPPQTTVAGFPLWDPPAAVEMSGEVNRFLDAGDPPIVFAPGSANVQAGDFFRTAVETCRLLGRRGMLMTKYPEQLPASLPESVRHFGFVPFSLLLPRAAALVHHGGIGTCAQGLASALPQIVMPMAYDQLDNGLRLKRLGVGDVVAIKKFRPQRVVAALRPLLESTVVKQHCQELAARCDGGAAMAKACDVLEYLHARRDDKKPAIASPELGATFAS